jgi:hypothetical protein
MKNNLRAHMSLKAVVDDSTSTICPYYILAGWVAVIPIWDSFEAEWDRALAELPAATFFRSNSATGLKGPFQGWSEGSRNAKVSNLAQVITRHNLFGIACYVHKQVFADNIGKLQNRRYKDPYFICALGIVSLCQRYFIEQKIDFVFDKQGKTGVRFKSFYDSSVIRRDAPNLGELSLLDDKAVLPLQAADMYAAFARNILSTVSLANAYDSCLASVRSYWFEVTPPFIFQLADRLNAYRSGRFSWLTGIEAKHRPSC